MKQTAKQLIRELFSLGWGITVQELNKNTRFNHLDRARRLVIEEEPHKYRRVRIKPESGRSYWVYFQNRGGKFCVHKIEHGRWIVLIDTKNNTLHSKVSSTKAQAMKLIKKCGE